MNRHIFLLLLIGFLSAFPPFVTDLYLPALPSLTEYFKTSPSPVQMSLTMSMVGLALGQLFIGPLSDKYGRKRLLLLSLVAFVVSTVLCIVSPNIVAFDACRLLQGMAASGGIVIARAMSTDKCRGKVLTKFLAVVSAINGVAPVTAPVLGGLLLGIVDWRGAFVVLLVYGFALLYGSVRISETLPESRRSHASLLFTFRAYGNVLKNPSYRLYLLLYAISAWVLFAYISASPFILQQGYGLSPMAFSFCFAVNAIAIGLGCAFAGKGSERKMILVGGISLCTFGLLTAFALRFHAPLFAVEACFVCLLFSFGLLQPPSTSLALNSERKNAGTASALLGASGFLMGGIVTPLVGIGDIFRSLGIAILSGAALTLVVGILAYRNLSRRSAKNPE